jgi:ribonucleoside-diphosphate reductase alpha chain
LTHRFKVANFKGYITIGFYPDGRVGEIFIEAEKQGTTISGILAAFARSISMGLQYGIPLDKYTGAFKHMRFEPQGFTETPEIKHVSSIMDYVFKYLELRFGDGTANDKHANGEAEPELEASPEKRRPDLGDDEESYPPTSSGGDSSSDSRQPSSSESRVYCKPDS